MVRAVIVLDESVQDKMNTQLRAKKVVQVMVFIVSEKEYV